LFELESAAANTFFQAQAVQNFPRPGASYPQSEETGIIRDNFYDGKPFSELLSPYSGGSIYEPEDSGLKEKLNEPEENQTDIKDKKPEEEKAEKDAAGAKKPDKTKGETGNSLTFLNLKEVSAGIQAGRVKNTDEPAEDFNAGADFAGRLNPADGYSGEVPDEVRGEGKGESAEISAGPENEALPEEDAADGNGLNPRPGKHQAGLKEEAALKAEKAPERERMSGFEGEKEAVRETEAAAGKAKEPEIAGAGKESKPAADDGLQNKKQKAVTENTGNTEKAEVSVLNRQIPAAGKANAGNRGEEGGSGDRNQDKKKLPAEKSRAKEVFEKEIHLPEGKTETVTQVKTGITESGGTDTPDEVEITVNIKVEGQNIPPEGREFASFRAEQSLENFLSRELHQDLNGDIVRQANIMLRAGGEGTIRLALHPASLGNVKIRLELSDNRITGKVTVESREAFRAFESELESLQEAFKSQGFESASLDMHLAGGGAGAAEDAGALKLSYEALMSGYKAARYGENASVFDLRDIYSSLLKFNQVNLFA